VAVRVFRSTVVRVYGGSVGADLGVSNDNLVRYQELKRIRFVLQWATTAW